MERHSFTLENLEGRTLYSAVAPLDATPMTATALQAITQAVAASPSPFPSAFNVAGTFNNPFGNPDSGSLYQFTGAGKTKTLGAFTLSGRVTAPGLIANGHTSGIVIITTAHGTIRMSVVGPTQGPGTLPSSFTFKIVRGSTGTYAHSSAKGTILVSASGTTHKFLFTFKPAG